VLINGSELLGLLYLGIGLLVTIFIKGGKSFPEGTNWYEKALGVAFMVVLWPIVLCVLSPGRWL
jgi:succinate dehydrogenase/fumarate reductase cytochrome b subunit